MIYKVQGLINSEIVTSLVLRELETTRIGHEICGWIDVFNNCRETGYILRDGQANHNIWICEHRNSDDIMVYTGTTDGVNCMFSDETWSKGCHTFPHGDYQGAADFIVEFIKANWIREYICKFNEKCYEEVDK